MAKKIISRISFIVLIGFLVGWLVWPEKEIKYPAGILINEAPYQKNIVNGQPWEKDDFKITPLADFHLKARVLSLEWYHMDKESDLAPIDLALGWGEMSDQANLDRIDISQSNRWYHWSTKRFPIPRQAIESESANMHIIPANEQIEDTLDNVVKGNIIELTGYLVFIEGENGWKWKSSLTRNDTGGGACEVIWVNDFKILR
ncbi:MAG: hypothetical protein WCE54_06375 [Ignavibacteriaceae bacterium]